MIEVLSFKEVNKGSFIGIANIKVRNWGIVLNKVGVFGKDGRRWINMPQEIYEDKGEKKYYPLVKFEDSNAMNKFQEAVLVELDRFQKKLEPKDEFPC